MEAEVKPARREFNVEVPKRCPACGSENVVVRVLPDANQARILCRECNNSYALPHTEVYYNKRVNSSLINWAHQVKKRDGYRCVICGSETDVQAHHIIPMQNDPDRRYAYRIGNGVTLCRKCHEKVHAFMMNDGDGE